MERGGGCLICKNRSEGTPLVRFSEAAQAGTRGKRIGEKQVPKCLKRVQRWIWGPIMYENGDLGWMVYKNEGVVLRCMWDGWKSVDKELKRSLVKLGRGERLEKRRKEEEKGEAKKGKGWGGFVLREVSNGESSVRFLGAA